MNEVKNYADRAIEKCGFQENPYFEALRDGTMPLSAFRRTQEQFYFAVEFYPRPMAALVAKIPRAEERLDILHNVVEEHGDFNTKAFHKNSFRRFLRSIGGDVPDLSRTSLWPELRAFNSVLTAACVLDEMEVGIGVMGIIEYAFSDASSAIGQAVIARDWVGKADLAHYNLHGAIDKRHAEEFFAVLEPRWADKDRRYFIQQGLELGLYALDRLYRDLHLSQRSAIKNTFTSPLACDKDKERATPRSEASGRPLRQASRAVPHRPAARKR